MANNETSIADAQGQELVTEDMSFLEDMAGQGLEEMSGSALATAYLGFVQPDSSAEDADHPAGTWRNSANGHNYGSSVDVIVLAFKTIWNERESVQPFRTVARYEPNSIQLEIKQPPKGARGYPKMINPESGNEVQELFIYAVILPDYPEEGVMYFNPTVSSMKTCRAWNSQLHGQILKSGAQAPIFAFRWTLTADLVDNPQQKNKQIAKLVRVERGILTSKDLFTTHVAPKLTAVKQEVLAITSNIDTEDESVTA